MLHDTNTTQTNQIGICVATDSRNELMNYLSLEHDQIASAIQNVHDLALYCTTEPIQQDDKLSLYLLNDLKNRILSIRKEVINED